jgi:hypothetical protein
MAVNNSRELFCEGEALGRKKKWSERTDARFPEGTMARIDAVLMPKEARTDFIHSAVESELEKRESGASGPKSAAQGRADVNSERKS